MGVVASWRGAVGVVASRRGAGSVTDVSLGYHNIEGSPGHRQRLGSSDMGNLK